MSSLAGLPRLVLIRLNWIHLYGKIGLEQGEPLLQQDPQLTESTQRGKRKEIKMRSPLRISLLVAMLIVQFRFLAPANAEEDPTFGTWALGNPAPGHLLATHSTLLRNNKILVVGGSSYNQKFAWGKEEARLYDIATGTWSDPAMTSPAPYGSDKDAFCSGHVHDDKGGVIFQGGLLGYYCRNGHGIDNSARYDVSGGTFSQLTGAAAHWYPTLVAGAGHIFIFPGANTQCDDCNTPPPCTRTSEGYAIQKLAYGATSWTTTNVTSETFFTYPRVCFLPNGKFFIASPARADRKNYIFDPLAETLTLAGYDEVPESEGQIHADVSWKGTGVLLPLVPTMSSYPQMRFALFNGIKAWVKDLGQDPPTWQQLGTRPPELPTPERHYANSTLLPTGQVLLTGGVAPPNEDDSSAVKKAEVYDSETNGWLLTSAATVPRNYHGVALLLLDGRVWTAGASQDHSGSDCETKVACDGSQKNLEKTEERVEIFTPWYVGRNDRPVVTSHPAAITSDGQQFDIGIGGSQGKAITRVVLMRAGSVTHAYDSDQRQIQLDLVFNATSKVSVKSPYSADAAPPGDYLLFALRSVASTGFKRWVPSIGSWIRVIAAPKPEGAPIWRYTGTPCSGESCPGWQKLDNNPKTVEIVAAGGHHEQSLYQLHNDGWIWRFTGTPCSIDSCPGWQRLDNNSKTIALTGAGIQLYQLHNDGMIWRYTSTPCSGDSCPGWQKLDNNTKTVGIVAAGNQLYQLHNDGMIWRYTGTPCSGDSCPGWQKLDNNSKTVGITAAGNQLYQLHNDGMIWRYTGTPCSDDSCPGWQKLDNNSKTVGIAAAGNQLYQLHNDGMIWRYTGTPCSGESCPGWERLDNNSRTVLLAATGSTVFQTHNDGRIWLYTGTPCSGDSCPGWQLLDNNPRTGAIAAGDPPWMASGIPLYQLHIDPLYQLHGDGAIWRYTGTECVEQFCLGWERLDNNINTTDIAAAGSQLFQRHKDGSIWRYIGTPCSGNSCPGWEKLDNNPKTAAIAAGGTQLYQRHNDGAIWRYIGNPCGGESCTGWEALDNNRRTKEIATAANQLFQLHDDGTVWRSTGTPCSGASCPGWQQLDNNPRTKAIATAANQLFQLHNDGTIWRSTGTPCSGASCPGWQQLDNNPKTVAITGGGDQLYQLHKDGMIWRYTGTPCQGAGCPGWERLDNNSHTREMVAAGGHLYQRHDDGRIWRYVGPPCSGDSCPGWQQLDNNPKTQRIAVGGFN
jgi:Domain of unknown function (DUF1929)